MKSLPHPNLQSSWSRLLGATLVGVGILCTATSQAAAGEIWLSPYATTTSSTNFATTAGTPSQPYGCPDWTSLSYVLSQFTTTSTVFHFMPGNFLVGPSSSSWAYGILAPTNNSSGAPVIWKFRGAGVDVTTLQAKASSLSSGYNLTMIAAALGSQSDGMEVSDLTVDCNLSNQVSTAGCQGISLSGSNTKISNVKVINWGVHAGGMAYPLQILPAGANSTTNCVIEKCVVAPPANVSNLGAFWGISIMGDTGTATNLINGAILRDNLVYGIPVGTNSGQVAWGYALSAYGTVTHNQVVSMPGCSGVFRSGYPGGNIFVEGNVFDNIDVGVNLDMEWDTLSNVVIKNNVIRVSTWGLGVGCYTGNVGSMHPNAGINGLVISDNCIYPATGASNVTALSLNGKISATVLNNVLESNNSGTGLYVNWPNDPWGDTNATKALQINTWSGNVNMEGTALNQTTNTVSYWQPGDGEETVKFTPTTSGWYRVLEAGWFASGAVRIESPMWINNNDVDVELSFSGIASGTGNLVETRNGNSSSPVVTQARLVEQSTSPLQVWLEIHVPSIPTGGANEIRVSARGPFRGHLQAPVLNTSSVTPVASLTF